MSPLLRRQLLLAVSVVSLLALAFPSLRADEPKKPAEPDPAIDKILPVPADIRKIFDRNCVMCHGEVIDGKAEHRGGFELTSDATIRDTLSKAGKLKQMILENKMPAKTKLSKRLRDNQPLADRLAAIKADWDKHGERDRILAWLEDITATTGDDD